MKEPMDLPVFYWTFSSCFTLFPIIEASVLLPKRKDYLFRMAISVLGYLFAACYIAKVMPHNHFFETIPQHFLSFCIFIFCNLISFRMYIYFKIICTSFEFLAQQITCLFVCIFFSDRFYENLFPMKIIVNSFVLFSLFFYLKAILKKNILKIPASSVTLSALIAIIGIVFNSISFELLQIRTSLSFLYQTFCMLSVLLALHIQIQLYSQQSAQNEIKIMNRLWLEQQKQFEIKKEYMDLINQKYHNLKHERSAMRYQKEMAADSYNDVKKYEYIVHTDHPLLDTILTEKMEAFEKSDIAVNCMLDEHLNIGFIDIADLYIILGNALDNALESLKEIKNSQNRYINFRIFQDKQLFRIIIKNNYEGCITYENGLPSTQKDKKYHGYGLKSIQYILKKYDGAMVIETEHQEFILRIMIPIP